MDEQRGGHILQDLIDRGPQWIIQQVDIFDQSAPDLTLLCGIEAGARSIAITTGDIEWANVAIRAAELLAKESSGFDAQNALLKAMYLRVALIESKGVRYGDPILDPAPIFRWFCELATMSPQEAIQRSNELRALLRKNVGGQRPNERGRGQEWGDRDRADLLLIKYIGSAVGVLKRLRDGGILPDNFDADEWIRMKDELL